MTIIHDGADFKIESQGNGWAYTITHKPSGRDMFFQDDDAHAFELDVQTHEAAHPDADYDYIAECVWRDYRD